MKHNFDQKALELPKGNSLAFNVIHQTAIEIDSALDALASGHHSFSAGETYRSARNVIIAQIGAFQRADTDLEPHLNLLNEMYRAIAEYRSVV